MSHSSHSRPIPRNVKAAILVFGLAAIVVFAISAISQHEWSFGRLALFVGLALATARKRVQLGGTSSVSLLTSVVLLAVMLDGPGTAALVAMCGVITQTLQPKKKVVLHQIAFNASMITLTVAATTIVFHWVARDQGFSGDLVAMIAASITYFLGNSIFVATIIALSKNASVVRIWRDSFANTAPSFLIGGMLSLAVVQLLVNPIALVVAVPAMYAIYNSSIRLASRGLA